MYLAPYGPKEFGLSESPARSGKESLAQRFTLDRLWPQRAREHNPGFTLGRLWPKGPGEHSPGFTLGIPPHPISPEGATKSFPN
jgi:hypothetical protein